MIALARHASSSTTTNAPTPSSAKRISLTYRLGDQVRVRLEEATPLTGGLRALTSLEGGSTGTPMRRTSGRAEKRGGDKRGSFKRGGRGRR